MRILLIARCPPYPLYLGDRLIVYHLAEELEARGHEIDLLAYANLPGDWHEQDKYDHLFGEVRLFPEPKRSQLDYLRRLLILSMRWPAQAEQSWSPDLWQAIRTQLKATKYDVVHLFGGIQVYEFYRALGDVPALITPYESYSLYLRRLVETLTPSPSPSGRGEQMQKLKRRLMTRIQLQIARQFESWMFTPYRHAVVVSERDRDELLMLNPTLKIAVIPNGVDTYAFRPRPTRRVPALLFVGNYEYAPNVDAALRLAHEILPEVQKRLPDVRLWLVGNAPPPELKALQQPHPLTPSPSNREGEQENLYLDKAVIRVTGRVPDVRPYLARAGAFVSPLRLGAGIKNKVLEALAMGCPVIATPLSMDGIHVQNGHDALVADGAAMIEAIVQALEDTNLQAQLSVNGRKLIEQQYSWDSVGARYEQLYKDISS